jgi:pimeloyl-ACP methyl ester carboxylesterase
VVGHDWGAPVAWHTALLRPDRVAAVAGFSVPYFPRSPTRPSMAMPREGGREFYQAYFCREGLAEVEFGADMRGTLRDFNWLWSGDNPDHSTEHLTMVREGGPMRECRSAPAVLPAWVSEADIDVYEQAFKASGFRGPLNWYRQIDRNWEQTAAFTGAQIRTPALYMVGEHDLLLRFKAMDKLLPNLERVIPGLTAKIIEPGCGHWIQRERAQRVNEELLRLLATHWPA